MPPGTKHIILTNMNVKVYSTFEHLRFTR